MFTSAPVITDVGVTLLVRAAAGEQITLTHFQAGNGMLDTGETLASRTALKSLVVDDIPITASDDSTTGYLALTGLFDNQVSITEDLEWRELGLIAEDENGEQYLYAYAYNITYPELIRAGGGATMIEQYIQCTIPIGTSGNIDADVSSGGVYALTTDFNAHLADVSNPHQATYTQIGAAASSHTHSASAITKGILPASFGGTGFGSIEELEPYISDKVYVGYFVGDAQLNRRIDLGFKPSLVAIFYEVVTGFGRDYLELCAVWEGRNFIKNNRPAAAITEDADTLFARRLHGVAAVTDTGFAVSSDDILNGAGDMHFYIAIR